VADSGQQAREVTYHAVDRGASCLLGCLALSCLLLGVGMGLWFVTGGMAIWKAAVAVLGVGAGISLVAFLRSPMRGRWEVTFDPEARIVRIYTRVRGKASTEEIGFDEIERIGLTPVERETSRGEMATSQLAVLYLKGGREPVRFDERLSISDPERAEEVLAEMNELLGEQRAMGNGQRAKGKRRTANGNDTA